jgi:hypothetical protein
MDLLALADELVDQVYPFASFVAVHYRSWHQRELPMRIINVGC